MLTNTANDNMNHVQAVLPDDGEDEGGVTKGDSRIETCKPLLHPHYRSCAFHPGELVAIMREVEYTHRYKVAVRDIQTAKEGMNSDGQSVLVCSA
jgi:hypothetical protein